MTPPRTMSLTPRIMSARAAYSPQELATDPVVEAVVDMLNKQESRAKDRTLGQIVVSTKDAVDLVTGERRTGIARANARIRNLLLVDPRTETNRVSLARPRPMDTTPLLDAIDVVDDAYGMIQPVTVGFTSAAGVVAEGAASGESTVTYVTGDWEPLVTISHHIPVTKQAVNHIPTLRSDVDRFLAAGVLVQLEDLVADTITAASGLVLHAFNTDVATTIRTAIAAAQSAFVELGPSPVTVVLSPNDHAALDLAGFDVSLWPAAVVSSPSVPDGFAYVGRFNLAVQLQVSKVLLQIGYIGTQFIENEMTVQATAHAFAHVTAPGAIVKADLTAV